jgi:hypothetical protein
MKVQWDENDVLPGRQVRKPGTHEVCIIGFNPCVTAGSYQKWAVISLADGMIIRNNCTKTQLVEYLNENVSMPVELLDEKGRIKGHEQE